MEISKRIRHEHAELRSLAQQILNQNEGADGRQQDFRDYERQLREHLDLFETFFLTRLKENPSARDSVADLKSEHAVVRKELKALHKGDKDSHQWSAEFRRFTDRFEQLCHRHDALVTQAEAGGRSESLDQQYEQAKAKRTRGFLAPSGRGSTTAMVVGAAAAAGAAYVISRYFNKGLPAASTDRLRRLTSRSEEGSFSVDAGEARAPRESTLAPGVTQIEYPAPDTDGARIAPDPAKAPSASGIVIG
jgi:hypothetical protein